VRDLAYDIDMSTSPALNQHMAGTPTVNETSHRLDYGGVFLSSCRQSRACFKKVLVPNNVGGPGRPWAGGRGLASRIPAFCRGCHAITTVLPNLFRSRMLPTKSVYVGEVGN